MGLLIMADTTLTLAQVDTAITAILLTGQAYQRPGLTLTRANLSELRRLRSELAVEDAANDRMIVFDTSSMYGGSQGEEWND
jgi:hypothetical protein